MGLFKIVMPKSIDITAARVAYYFTGGWTVTTSTTLVSVTGFGYIQVGLSGDGDSGSLISVYVDGATAPSVQAPGTTSGIIQIGYTTSVTLVVSLASGAISGVAPTMVVDGIAQNRVYPS
ncbi:MAG: hypothetical protein JZD41_06525 [Thermoproteus sp.]|nr:hypothetical protein [Thermoproteus sp.]